MATNADRILAYLRSHPEGADDDQLSSGLRIYPRQQVNQICRRLAAQGQITREQDPRRNKIVNRVGAARNYASAGGEWRRPNENQFGAGEHDSEFMRACMLLHLQAGAPLDIAEAAYRVEVKRFHPDLGGDHAQMATLNWAIEVIRRKSRAA